MNCTCVTFRQLRLPPDTLGDVGADVSIRTWVCVQLDWRTALSSAWKRTSQSPGLATAAIEPENVVHVEPPFDDVWYS